MTWWYVLAMSIGMGIAVFMFSVSIRQLTATFSNENTEAMDVLFVVLTRLLSVFGILVSLAICAVMFMGWQNAVIAYCRHR